MSWCRVAVTPRGIRSNKPSSTTTAFFYAKLFDMKARTLKETSAIGAWLDMESKSFTALCGEPFTHFEVLCVMAGSMALIPLVCLGVYVVSWLAGGLA